MLPADYISTHPNIPMAILLGFTERPVNCQHGFRYPFGAGMVRAIRHSDSLAPGQEEEGVAPSLVSPPPPSWDVICTLAKLALAPCEKVAFDCSTTGISCLVPDAVVS